MKKLISTMLLTVTLFLTGCVSTGYVRESSATVYKVYDPLQPVVVYPEYYYYYPTYYTPPMYIHWRFDIGRGWAHHHHRGRR
jgi:hypothetical protein